METYGGMEEISAKVMSFRFKIICICIVQCAVRLSVKQHCGRVSFQFDRDKTCIMYDVMCVMYADGS
jgi:hypothetical protein